MISPPYPPTAHSHDPDRKQRSLSDTESETSANDLCGGYIAEGRCAGKKSTDATQTSTGNTFKCIFFAHVLLCLYNQLTQILI